MVLETDSLWGKLAQELSKRIAALIMQIISPCMEQFFKNGVALVFTEDEAAGLLKVSPHTLALWRKNRQINHYGYTKSATYGLHHLAEFIQRNEHKNLPPLFELQTQVSLWGAGIQPTKINKNK